jgi:ferredoxin
MADFRHRYAENVPGRFYTDILCLDCTACREIAPTIFARDEVHNSSYVFKQPSTLKELEQCEECVARCPCEAIGEDGDVHDWAEPADWAAERSRSSPSDLHARPGQDGRRWKLW